MSITSIFDENIKLTDNAMLKVRPDLFEEWHFKKNDELGLDIWKITKGSNKKVWWECIDCKSSYEMSVNKRTCRNSSCPYCSGHLVNHTNSLFSNNLQLGKQWHPTKNGDLTPHGVTCNSNKKVWWLGECGHEWVASIINRSRNGRNCPYCSNQKILIDFNDMWTTNPELASLLANPDDGYKYMQCSGKKVDWKCFYCDTVIINKTIADVKNQGLSCPVCSDGFSYPEKFMYNLLKQLNIEFDYQSTFRWSSNKRYDFYLAKLNIIIETHGIQHFEQTKRKGARTLKEEQANDRLKEQLAKENGIEHYIVIDCRYSKFEFIKGNILKSELAVMFDLKNIKWEDVHTNAIKSINPEVLLLWNEGCTTKEISRKLKVSTSTIVDVLKNYSSLKMCDFKYRKRLKKVYQFDKNLNFIKSWSSAKDIKLELGINDSLINLCCNGKQETSHGYIWKYENDLVGWTVPINN